MLKKLLLVLVALVGLIMLLIGVEFVIGATAKPVVAVNYSREMHDLMLERQRGRLGGEAAQTLNQRPAFESIMVATREANDWLLEHSNHLSEQDQRDNDFYDDPWQPLSLDAIYTVPREGTPQQFERARRRVVEALAEWERRGVFERSAELPGLGPIARAPGEGPLLHFVLPHLGTGRVLARAQAARARVAAETGDHETLLRAIEETYALGRLIAGQGTLIDWLVGVAIQMLGQRMILDNLLLHPVQDDAWLARVDAIVQREAIELFPPLTDAFDAERMISQDLIQRCYSDNGKGDGRFIPVRFARLVGEGAVEAGNHITPFGDTPFSNMHARLFVGRKEATEWLDRGHELLAACASATGPAAQSADDTMIEHFETGSTWDNPLEILQPSFGRMLEADRRRRVMATGVRVMLAVERYRARQGQIPETLDRLGDLLPDEARTDPFTGQPWAYRPAPVTSMADGDELLPGHTVWPYTLRSQPIERDQDSRHYLDPSGGLLISEPIQGPRFDEP